MLLNDLMKQFDESVGETGPKFTGYWKGKDAGTPGKKMVGSESVKESPKQGMGAKTRIDPDLLNALALKKIHDKEAEKLKTANKLQKEKSTKDMIKIYAISIPTEYVKHYIETEDKDFALKKATNWQMNKMPQKFKEIVSQDENWKNVILKIWDQAKLAYKGKQLPQPKKAFPRSKDVSPIELAGGDTSHSQELVRKLNLIIADYRKKYGIDIHGLRLPGYAPMENAVNEEENPIDKITMDIPLFVRMMEYAREDAKDDMDLHQVTARAIQLMQQHDALDMNSYDTIINDQEPVDEGWLDKVYAAGRNFADTASLGTAKYGRAGIDWAAKNAMHQLGYADQGTSYQKELDQEIEKLDKDWKEEPGASLAGMGAALAIPIAGEYGAAVKGAQGLAGQALDTYGKAVKMYPLAKAALGYKDMKNPKVEDVAYQNPNLTPDQINKMNSTIQKTLKNKPYDVDKSAKDPRSFQQRLPQGKDTAPMPEYNRDVPNLMKTVPKKPSSQKMVNASMEMDEEKKGLYYYVNKRKKAGTSRDKDHPKAPSAQDWKNAAKTAKKESVELEENLLSRIAGLVGAYYGAQMGIPDAIMSTMDMPLGTYELTQHVLGGVAGYALGATMGDVAIGSTKALTKRMIRGALNKAMQAIKGGTPQEQAWKNYEAEVKVQYDKIKQAAAKGNKQEPRLIDKNTNQTESKIKGKDGKACWKGYRYAGTEYGKDKCVPVKKGK